MKVILVGPAFPFRGGIANFNEALCLALLKKGVDCSIISFSLQYPGFLFPGKSQIEGGFAPESFKIYDLINSINPFSWFRAAAFIRKQNPDFIIIRYWLPFMAPCLGTIARLLRRKTKIIAITDNIIPHEKRPGDKLLTGYFVNSCDAFMAMSKSVLQDLDLFTSNKNKYFSPHPIYDIFGEPVEKLTARAHLKLDQKARYILFFGFIRKYKGLDLLLEAMGTKEVKDEKVTLIVAGEFYEEEQGYLDIIKKNGLQNQVILKTSFIPREEVKYYFSACDMVVQPYREATQSGITQIAYQFEKPMLVTRVGGLPEMVNHDRAGYVTEVSKDAIAIGIVDFYRKNKEADFSSFVKSEKKNFLWSTFVDKLLQAFTEIEIR